MNSEEQFKKSLNDLLDSKEFPFEEASWEKAQALIDGTRKRRRGLLIFLSALFILGGGAGLYMILPEQALTSQAEVVSAPVVIPNTESAVKENPSIEILATEIPAEKTSLPDKNTNAPAVKSVPAPISPPAQSKTTKSDVPVVVPELPAIADAPAPVQPPAQTAPPVKQNPIEQPAVKQIPVDQTPVKETPVKETPVYVESAPAVAVTQLPVINENTQTPAEPVKEEKENVQNSTPATKKFEDFTTKVVPATEEPVVNQSTLPPVQPVTSKSEETTSTQPVKNTDEIKSAEIAAVSESVTPEPITEKTVPHPDTLAAVAAALPDTDYVKLKNPLLTIEGGMSGLKGWNNGERAEAGGFNPIIGINYFTHFMPRWALSIGVQYSSVAELQNSKVIVKKTKLGLGEHSEVTVFTPVKLHYITAPIRLNYQLNNSNFIGIGCNIARLLTVDCEIEQYTQINNTTTNHSFSKDRGYTQGFNEWDTQAAIFYKRRLYKEFYMNAEFFYGFTDIKDDLFFKTPGQEKNIGLKLTLVYTLLKTK